MLVWVGAVSPALTSAMIKELRQQRFDPRPAAANASIAAASWVDYQNTTVMESAWLQKQAVLREAAARARSTRRSAWPVVHHVTYASGCCATILQKNHDAAVQHGALTSLALGPADLNPTWYLENDAVLRSKRGAATGCGSRVSSWRRSSVRSGTRWSCTWILAHCYKSHLTASPDGR